LRFSVAIVAVLALLVAAPATASGQGKPLRAHAAKKCKKKHGKKRCKKRKQAPAVTPPASGPLPLSAQEVIDRVVQKAGEYCAATASTRGCYDYGYYYDTDPSDPACAVKTTYSWSCYGWNQDYISITDPQPFSSPVLCDFLEVVDREGDNGITSHQDLSFGGAEWGPGWDCIFGTG
jgi:hypothetical protein